MNRCIECGDLTSQEDMIDGLCYGCYSALVKTWTILDEELDRLGL